MEAGSSGGLSWLNADHEVLELLLDSLIRAASSEGSGDAAREVLLILVEASTEHFSGEQELMQALAYPAYEAHADAHDWFLDRVQVMLECDNRADMAAVCTVARELRPWLAEHTRTHDVQLASYFRRRSGR